MISWSLAWALSRRATKRSRWKKPTNQSKLLFIVFLDQIFPQEAKQWSSYWRLVKVFSFFFSFLHFSWMVCMCIHLITTFYVWRPEDCLGSPFSLLVGPGDCTQVISWTNSAFASHGPPPVGPSLFAYLTLLSSFWTVFYLRLAWLSLYSNVHLQLNVSVLIWNTFP